MTSLATATASPAPLSDFDYVRELVRRSSAIVLEPTKEYLVEARLGPLARKEGLASIAELVAKLRGGREDGLTRKVIDAMTTNETLFFRDVHPFETLRTHLLPELLQSRAAARHLRIWSAACSTGQEPYTIAMLLREHFPELASWRIDILATDLSTEVLAKARQGIYGQIEVNRGLPAKLMVKYFTKQGVDWQIDESIRSMVEFRELNLAETWPSFGQFDVVFLRNVLIYFDADTKKAILGRVRRLLRPDGCLFLGAAETTMNLDESFERAQLGKGSCYRLKPEAGAAPR
jgi:chemotaxis protein methyltransferase CheR